MATVTPIDVKSHFKAEWPRHLDPALESTASKVKRILWNLLSIIIFPIGLCRLAYWTVRSIALKMAIPGPPYLNGSNGKVYLDYYGGKNVKPTSPDGLKLDGAFFPGENREKAVIFSCGNAMSWETTELYIELLKPLGVSILMVNPRGIVKSEGSRSEEGFALDIYTAYEYLIGAEKVDPNEIVHVGFSMGGGYGAEGAALVQKKYPHKKLSAINIRSFSDLGLEVQALLGKVGGCLPSLMRLGAKLANFQMHPKKALDTLKGRVCVVSTPSDGVIVKVASMIEAMKKDPKRPFTHIELHGDHTVSAEAHIRDFLPDERLAILEELRLMLHLEEDELDQKLVHIFEQESEAFEEDPYVHLTPLRVEQIG